MAEDEATRDGDATADLQAQLDEARAEIERLERDAANASAQAYRASSEADGMRAALAEANDGITSSAQEADELRRRIDEASEREQQGAVRYRELMLRAEPALPAEMITGNSIDEIDASVIAARDVVGRVRSHLETQTSAARVPAGAPQRGKRDVGAMSPQQKIRYGLEQRTQT